VRFFVQRVLNRLGYRIERRYPRDFTSDVISVLEQVGPYTLTTPESIASVCATIEYVTEHQVPGDIVECGVWRGGSMMAAALTLKRLGSTDRALYLFDTYAGMSEPTDVDVSLDGQRAHDIWRRRRRPNGNEWCYVTLEEVERAMLVTGYDPSRIHLVQGKVEDTLPDRAPDPISFLRLDTDWYESTRHELVHLFPRLSVGGVLTLDDYGKWQGSRKAADEYFAENRIRILLDRVDDTARLGVKQSP
jgi:O-methyltransferase